MSPKKLLALSALVVLLCAVIPLFERKMPTTDERSRKGDLYWDIAQDRVERIEVSRGTETLEFQRAGDAGWRCSASREAPGRRVRGRASCRTSPCGASAAGAGR
jgi:hypothetical protein